jgi:hypothetical protein
VAADAGRGLRIVPKGGIGYLLLQIGELLFKFRQVKDASEARRFDR